MKKNEVKKIGVIGLLIALAYTSLFIIRIPIIPSATFLRFDVKDVFIAIIGLLYGPAYAFVGAFGVSFLQMLSVSEYGVIGLIMNILSVSAFTVPLAFVYKLTKTRKGFNIGLGLGCMCMTAAMPLWNYLFTPLYMGVTREVVKSMLLPVFLPFNIIKSTINAILVYIIYFAIKRMQLIKTD
ncbi:MAG: ECF transporter S component [Lachnospiraceae bacterium]